MTRKPSPKEKEANQEKNEGGRVEEHSKIVVGQMGVCK
jgi:hypothetical protein